MQNNPQLFCFTHAGGSKSFFNEIEKDLSGIDVIKFEYAGHGERQREGYYDNFDQLADDAFRKVKSGIESEYALFGYSMGSISAVEVLRRILASGISKPQHVFLAAHEPHTKSELLGFSADELDDWVKNRTIQFGDVPEKLLNNKVFWRTYLPIYRADYTLIGKYEFEKLDLSTDIPVTVFYSETDTPLADMKQWEKYFTGLVNYRKFSGNHFFIREYHDEMAKIIRTELGENA